MVVRTCPWPRNSPTVLISFSKRCVAKECPKVWQVACFVTLVVPTAALAGLAGSDWNVLVTLDCMVHGPAIVLFDLAASRNIGEEERCGQGLFPSRRLDIAGYSGLIAERKVWPSPPISDRDGSWEAP